MQLSNHSIIKRLKQFEFSLTQFNVVTSVFIAITLGIQPQKNCNYLRWSITTYKILLLSYWPILPFSRYTMLKSKLFLASPQSNPNKGYTNDHNSQATSEMQ